MTVIFRTLKSALRPEILRLMVFCAFIAFCAGAAMVTGLTFAIDRWVQFDTQWLDTLVNWLSGFTLGIVVWFMLPALTVIVAGAFQETVIYKVEKKDYPEAMRTSAPKFWPDLWHDVKFTLWALFLNLLVLPFYFVGIGFPVSIALNTYLLGREFFEGAAGYHLGKKQAREIGKMNRFAVYSGGLVITLTTLVPILNLFVPILAIILMVHTYHRLKTIPAAP